jgi:hypothetical protein
VNVAIYAGFDRVGGGASTQIRSCMIYRPAGGNPPTIHPTAGTLLIASQSGTIATMVPDSTGTYTTGLGTTTDWPAMGAGTLMVRADGMPGGAPTFEGAVNTPPDIVLVQPVLDPSSTLTIRRTQPLVIQWQLPSCGSAGHVAVSVSAMNDAYVAGCEFAFESGSGTIPLEALELLPAGPGRIRVSADYVSTVGDADWRIGLIASRYAQTGANTVANQAITLE